MLNQGRSLVNTILRGTTRVPHCKVRHSLLPVTVQSRCALLGLGLSRAPLGSELPHKRFTGGLQPVTALSWLKQLVRTFSVAVFLRILI